MGTDIHGHIEIIAYPWEQRWTKVVDIEPLIHRNYNTFAYLFGVRNHHYVDPLAASRGIPEDADYSLFNYDQRAQAYTPKPEPGHSCSWIGYDELEKTFSVKKDYPDDWILIFKLMVYLNEHCTPDEEMFDDLHEDLRAIHRPCYCRLVVWFDS